MECTVSSRPLHNRPPSNLTSSCFADCLDSIFNTLAYRDSTFHVPSVMPAFRCSFVHAMITIFFSSEVVIRTCVTRCREEWRAAKALDSQHQMGPHFVTQRDDMPMSTHAIRTAHVLGPFWFEFTRGTYGLEPSSNETARVEPDPYNTRCDRKV